MSDDRQRGFLTPDDRNYIRHGRDYDHQQQHSNKRRTIRERIKHGILDFRVLPQLELAQQRKIYDQIEYGNTLYRSLVAMVAFVYQAVRQSSGDLDVETVLEEGIETGIQRYRHREPDTDVDIDVDPDDLSEEARAAADQSPPVERSDEESGSVRVLEDVTVTLEREYREIPDPIRLRRRFLDGEELTDQELLFLLRGRMAREPSVWQEFETRFHDSDE